MDSKSSLLARYRAATCLPFSVGPGKENHWDSAVSLRDGSKVAVTGAGWASGQVVVTYLSTNEKCIAAKPHDYIAPVDIRIDNRTDMLYIAASGLAGGVWQQTWLFAFDLKERRQTASRKIRYKDLPAGCPGPETAR
jgi:hypothetical protein